MARGRIYRQGTILRDEHGQPILGTDGKPKMKLRSANWWISYYDASGKRHYESSESTKKSDAERLLNLRLGAKEKGEAVGSQIGKVTFDDAVKAVITSQEKKNCRSTAREQGRIDHHLLPYFSGRRMASISSDDIDAYTVMRKKTGASNGTINRELQVIRRAFRLAVRAKKLTTVPYVEFLGEAEARKGFFERTEFEAVREHLPVHFRGLLTFYFFTGWRLSEALTLELRQVDLVSNIVSLDPSQSKNKHGRKFPIGQLKELRDVLVAQIASAERLNREASKIVTALFHMPNGSAINKDLEWREAWEAARKAAGYPTKLVHDFRRTAVRNLVRAGIPDSVAMKMTGHKTRSVFQRYDITTDEDLQDAGAKLQAFTVAAKQPKGSTRVRQFKRA